MHELSIAHSIVRLAEQNARAHDACEIEELELEIGALAGVDLSSLEFALTCAVKGSMLEKARIIRHDITGEGRCGDCGLCFRVEALFAACPGCGSFCIHIIKGKELRIKSIIVK